MEKFFNKIRILSRNTKVFIQNILDIFLIFLAIYIVYSIYLEFNVFIQNPNFWFLQVILTIFTLTAFWLFGLYRYLVRHLTTKIMIVVLKGVLLSTIVFYLGNIQILIILPAVAYLNYGIILFILTCSSRFMVRYAFRYLHNANKKPVLIFGAGEDGLQLLNLLYHDRKYIPVGLIDNDPKLFKLTISGLNVSSPDQLPRVISSTGAKVLFLAAPDMKRSLLHKLIIDLKDIPIIIKIIPAMSDLINGSVKIAELRTLQAEDLLGRTPIEPNELLMKKNSFGKSVLVSGAGGSIGSELCRQILKRKPSCIILFESSEFALYSINSELDQIISSSNCKTKIIPILGTVLNSNQLEIVIKKFKVQIIYHAAAYKHVPLVEDNVLESIQNNVLGTKNIVFAAKKYKVENFILISTDKAVRPTNVMGATKRIAELICQAEAQEVSNTIFSMVRFGNVLGSSGSVIPKFIEQIKRGGPVSLTHPEITRYFMTISEASQLVMQAGALAKGGDVFVLDMGNPVKMIDLAQSMIIMHGLNPVILKRTEKFSIQSNQILIRIVGLRKGEKLHEELLIGTDFHKSDHPKILTASEYFIPKYELLEFLNELEMAYRKYDLDKTFKILNKLPINYNPNTED